MPKIQPSILTLQFNYTTSGGDNINYIDLSQVASLVNRRFYRQGLNWAVAGIKVMTNGTAANPAVPSVVSIHKLPTSWVMSNAWHKGFAAWQRMNNEALSESESVKPKFLDYKVYADSVHHAVGIGGNLLPYSSTAVFAVPGEWESSKMIIPKTDGTDGVNQYEIIATGASYPGAGATTYDAVSLIEGYAASRGLPDVLDPNVPDDAASASGNVPENWIAATFNEGTAQDDVILGDMIDENNIAPYPFENDGTRTDTMYPGGANQLPGLEIHDQEYVSGTTIGGNTYLKGGMFPCGLIRIMDAGFTDGNNFNIQIDLVPGSHRGYACQSMKEM